LARAPILGHQNQDFRSALIATRKIDYSVASINQWRRIKTATCSIALLIAGSGPTGRQDVVTIIARVHLFMAQSRKIYAFVAKNTYNVV
jgi:hypothetical protein